MIGGNRKLGERELEAADHLEIISSISVGYDNYDVGYLNRRGIMLTNTPDVLNETTADLAFALIFATARRIPELDAWTKSGAWQKTIDEPAFGCDVHGKTLGIIGLGKIGAAIARRGHLGFGMTILYSGASRKPALEAELGAQWVPQDQLLREADFVCPVVPLTPETRNLISHQELYLMKPEAILINVSRPYRRRNRIGRCSEKSAHTRRRPGCVCKRAAFRVATFQSRQCSDSSSYRLCHCSDSIGYGAARTTKFVSWA